jgi:UDP-N-acetyl-D-mannosaminuronate dehydrogenase
LGLPLVRAFCQQYIMAGGFDIDQQSIDAVVTSRSFPTNMIR